MTILTEQEIVQLSDENLGSQLTDREFVRIYKFSRAIESAVIAKIKAQGPDCWVSL